MANQTCSTTATQSFLEFHRVWIDGRYVAVTMLFLCRLLFKSLFVLVTPAGRGKKSTPETEVVRSHQSKELPLISPAGSDVLSGPESQQPLVPSTTYRGMAEAELR